MQYFKSNGFSSGISLSSIILLDVDPLYNLTLPFLSKYHSHHHDVFGYELLKWVDQTFIGMLDKFICTLMWLFSPKWFFIKLRKIRDLNKTICTQSFFLLECTYLNHTLSCYFWTFVKVSLFPHLIFTVFILPFLIIYKLWTKRVLFIFSEQFSNTPSIFATKVVLKSSSSSLSCIKEDTKPSIKEFSSSNHKVQCSR